MELEAIINIWETFKTLQRGGLWKYLGNSQNTTGQPEVQGTQTQHNQKYQEDLDNLGNRGGGHLISTENFYNHTVN